MCQSGDSSTIAMTVSPAIGNNFKLRASPWNTYRSWDLTHGKFWTKHKELLDLDLTVKAEWLGDKPGVFRKTKDDISIVEAMNLFGSRSSKASEKMATADSEKFWYFWLACILITRTLLLELRGAPRYQPACSIPRFSYFYYSFMVSSLAVLHCYINECE